MPAKKKTSAKGYRLSTQAKNAIAQAPADVTNTALAEKYGTTLQTVARYRTTTSPRGRRSTVAAADASPRNDSAAPSQPKQSRSSIQMDAQGDYIVLTIHKSRKNVVQGLVDQLLS